MISEVYNMDCMEYMKTVPDKFFDIAIVDPPYGINAPKMVMGGGFSGGKYNSNRFKGAGKLKNRVLNTSDCSWDETPPTEDYFKELFRVSKNQIIWGGITFHFHQQDVLLLGINVSLGKTLVRLNWLGLVTINRQNFINR